MFSLKKEPEVQPVPVYTVHTLPQPYEIIQTLAGTYTNDAPHKIMERLGLAGAKIGADAVIGLMGVHAGKSATHYWGTAIRYIK
jgi:uncharacterized protein YbjQ (UPF0145 family)